MEKIIEKLIESLKYIDTPLKYWGLLLIILLIIFYNFSKYGKSLINSIDSKLARLLIIFTFILFSIVVVLSFLAPLISERYNKSITDQISESANGIKRSLELEQKYKQIIDFYESG